MYKKLVCLDFDGVLHSYKSGWQGPRNIPDPPVEGAIDWLIKLLYWDDSLRVCVYSSRSKYLGGRRAMKRWLTKHGLTLESLREIEFPTKKPAAWVTIDDRAIVFKGKFPEIEEIINFKPWNLQDM